MAGYSYKLGFIILVAAVDSVSESAYGFSSAPAIGVACSSEATAEEAICSARIGSGTVADEGGETCPRPAGSAYIVCCNG